MSESIGQIYGLIPKVMMAIGAIGKGRKNQQQNYSFRGIDDLYNAVQGPMMENGVFVVPEVTDKSVTERLTKSGGNLIYTTLTVKHTFYAPDGSNVVAVTVGEAMDSADKSSNKAMSAAMKYALLEVFCIPTEGDNDTENHTHPESRPVQRVVPDNPGAPSRDQVLAALATRKLTKAESIAVVKDWMKLNKYTAFDNMPDDLKGELLKDCVAGKLDPQPAGNAA